MSPPQWRREGKDADVIARTILSNKLERNGKSLDLFLGNHQELSRKYESLVQVKQTMKPAKDFLQSVLQY